MCTVVPSVHEVLSRFLDTWPVCNDGTLIVSFGVRQRPTYQVDAH